VLRKALILGALCALALPVVGLGSPRVGDGTLTVEDGRGKVTVQARGGLIGRLGGGSVTIFDLTPNDAHVPVVSGDDLPLRFIGRNGIRYRGEGIRFRLNGGAFRVVVDGRGINLSAVGRGDGYLEGDVVDPGLYSLDGADCRRSPATCAALPVLGLRFKLGGTERAGNAGQRQKTD
jgi:hypothetical protein